MLLFMSSTEKAEKDAEFEIEENISTDFRQREKRLGRIIMCACKLSIFQISAECFLSQFQAFFRVKCHK